MTTRAPLSARSAAQAAPMPVADPVAMQTESFRIIALNHFTGARACASTSASRISWTGERYANRHRVRCCMRWILPADGRHIRQAGLRFHQCDALPIQHCGFLRDKSRWWEWRSDRLVWQVDQFSNDGLIDTASYLLLWRKVPMADGLHHLFKLLNQLISGYVASASVG